LTPQLVYLFSSDVSPQYERDILNLLAAPKGVRWVFRYAAGVVSSALAEEWKKDELRNRPALVCFSLQQRRQYFEPAFIPVREATVLTTHVNGTQLLVHFVLGDLVTLPHPASEKASDIAKRVRDFTHWLREQVPKTDQPYEASVGTGVSVLNGDLIWKRADKKAEIFETATEWLAGTDSFRRTRFVRFDSICRKDNIVWSEFSAGEERIGLDGGRTYELRLVHFQPQSVADRQRFTVSADGDIIAIIGEPSFDIASRYDEIRIALHAQPLAGVESRDTVVVIEPSEGVDGPRIELPIRVKPSAVRTGVNVVGPLVVLSAVGLPSAFAWDSTTKVVVVLVGAILAVLLQLFGIKVPTVGNLFGGPTPTKPPTERS
jgi:hypothetical protein